MEDCAVGLAGLLDADVPGRSFNAAASDSCTKVEWYPSIADLAPSADLGFTAGPWVCSLAGGGQVHGHFVTLWLRDAGCGWQVQFDRGVSHPAPANLESKLVAKPMPSVQMDPQPKLAAGDAVNQAIREFQGIAQEDGLAPGLRTYARTQDFRFFTDQEAPMGLAEANRHFTDRPIQGSWQENARARSADSTLAYCAGEFTDTKQRSSHAYAQIWQYEPRVANWGLRVLLINRAH